MSGLNAAGLRRLRLALARGGAALERGRRLLPGAPGRRRGQRALILIALLLSACGEKTYTYNKRGATPAQLDRDLAACKKQAFRPSRFSLWPSGRHDTEVLNRCMERRGYVVRAEEDSR